MKLENQVCTLEQAKKLKTLLGELYGLFVYMENKALPSDSKIMLSTQTESIKQMGKIEGSAWIKYYPAFTVAELGVLIGNKYTLSETTNHKEDNKRWICGDIIGVEDGDYDYNNCCFGSTEAECRSNMLIHLIEKKLVEVEACNERLLA